MAIRGWWVWSMLVLGCAPRVVAPAAAVATKPAAQPERVVYCAGTVTEHDVDRCIWELTPEQQRHRPYSQRLTFRAGRLVSFETISGSGQFVKGENAHLFTYDGDQVSGWSLHNRNGVAKGTNSISADERWFKWLDEQGRPQAKKDGKASGLLRELDARGRVTSYAYVDSYGSPVQSENVFKVRVARNAQGAIVQESYFGRFGEPIRNNAGAHRVDHSVDAHGFDVEVRCFGVDGAPGECDGAHLQRIENDPYGNVLVLSYFDVDGRPTSSKAWGAALVRFERDQHGNETRSQLFDEAGKPVIGKSGYAARARRFNERDEPFESSWYGVDGAPLRLADTGSPLLRQERDERGNVTVERFYDEQGKPMLGREGFHRAEIGYDERDNPISYRYLDTAAAPVMITSGYHARKISYDGDRQKRTSYFDTRGELVSTNKGYAAWENVYAPDGSTAPSLFFDANLEQDHACVGKPSQELLTLLSGRAAATRHCYERLLASKPTAEGALMTKLRLDPSGRVLKLELESDEIKDEVMGSCVLAVMREPYELGPAGGCADVRVPLRFLPKK